MPRIVSYSLNKLTKWLVIDWLLNVVYSVRTTARVSIVRGVKAKCYSIFFKCYYHKKHPTVTFKIVK